MRVGRLLSVGMGVATLCLGLAAQSTGRTSLRGTVKDPSNAVMPGASIALANSATGLRVSATTNARGEYAFPSLSPGTYTVTVTRSGFAAQTQAVMLLVSQPATLNFTLSVQEAQSSVEVSAIAETINTTDATIGNAVGNVTIQALPMEGRNVPDLLSLQPGVVYLGRKNNNPITNGNSDSRSGAVSGVRSDQTNVTLDGVADNGVNGYAFTGVLRSTLDSVQEFRVVTSNSDASSGHTAGAQVVMVTKSGTNNLHGSLYEFNRNTPTSANDWFNKQAELAAGLPNKPGPLNRNTFGASLGGPLRKNKLFFFFNFEEQKTAENKEVTQTVPTASLRQGKVKYIGSDGNPYTLMPADIAAMDPLCAATCPQGNGVNQAVLDYLGQYPQPNGFNSGDGLNTASFSWSAPNPITLRTYIAKLDWQPSVTNHLFARGNLQHDSLLAPPQFPGGSPASQQTGHSGGFAFGDTWTVSPTMVNNLRYGFVDQKIATVGTQTAPYVSLSGISSLLSESSTQRLHVPVQNVVDDYTWIVGNHTLQFGANYRLVNDFTDTNANSFASAGTGVGDIYAAEIAGGGGSLDPNAFGYEAVSQSFHRDYDRAIADVAGLITGVSEQNNYLIRGANAALLPPNSIVSRHFRANELEWYIQDAWRVKPNLTLTFGLRQTLLQTPFEVNGQQVAPTFSLHDWFEARGTEALQGKSVQPLISFAPNGQAVGKAAYWPMSKANFAPRLAIAYSPDSDNGFLRALFGAPGTSSIRAGAGMYYNHFGEGVVNALSQYGSFGLSSTVSSPVNVWTVDNVPRFTGIGDLPYDRIGGAAPASVAYPYTPSDDAFGSGFGYSGLGVDERMKTPYSVALDASIQRKIPGGFTLELDYVGNFGHDLLQQLDLGEPLNLVDPKSGMDYFTAAGLLSQAALANGQDKSKWQNVQRIAYWEDLFPNLVGANGRTATQNIYYAGWYNRPGREVGSPYHLDVLCDWNLPFPSSCGHPSRYWNTQFSSLYAYSSIGYSNYNAAQIVLRHSLSHGLQIDLNYTYSHSFDLGSDAERANVHSSAASQILNSWEPSQNYASSDFDTRHIISADWVWQLPFGRGKAFGGNAGGVLDALIGGWQISGLYRWTSGFPFSILDGTGYSDNWLVENYMVQTGPIATDKHSEANGAMQVFADPDAVTAGVFTTQTPLRLSYAGDAGSRNAFRGDGIFDIDAAVTKSWTLHENQTLKFSWQTFNVTNSVRFDTNSLNTQSTSGSLGVYSAVLTPPRVMQFSLRYSF